MRSLLVILTLLHSSCAYAACYLDPKTKLVVCPPDGDGTGVGVGGWLCKPPDFAKLATLKLTPGSHVVIIPENISPTDLGVIKQQLELRRVNLEDYRQWSEQNLAKIPNPEDYKAAIEVYRTGIGDDKTSLQSIEP
ncbi:hypothetical protein [Pararhizobium sp.]|uniref:hypothetical protein n=1 Tax=Pararhizobium sp. TaxID=1977563 RepID=UPI0027232482|nr:hypothetical protein [Pararhizobium sp.]MDO9415370.1 hypothetical protein [Pararhizobium sp.]